MTRDDAEHTLFGDHLGTVSTGNRFPLVWRNLVDSLLGASTGAQCPGDVRHAPDAILVGDKEIVALPGEAIGLVEILDVAIDPFGRTFAFADPDGYAITIHS